MKESQSTVAYLTLLLTVRGSGSVLEMLLGDLVETKLTLT
jgi:hypothetical protein